MGLRRRSAHGVAAVLFAVLLLMPAPAYAAAANGCTTYPQTGSSVCGAILGHYRALGGPTGFLGHPVSDELVNPDGIGRRSFFQHGSIYWSPGTGAWEIGGAIFAHWGQYGYERGPLGYPTSDELTNPDGVGRRNTFQFEDAHIYWSPATGPWEIQGLIFARWGALNWEQGILGYPTSDELTNPDGVGKRNSFQRVDGHVYWSPPTGAHEIQGRIYQEWGQLGWERGALGYPVSDEVATTGAFVRYGFRRNYFAGGGLFYDGPNVTLGQYYPYRPPASPAVTAAARPAARAGGCPVGTTDYAPPGDVYDCVAVYRGVDPLAYPTVVREGFANRTPSPDPPGPDEGAAVQAGFGVRHAQDDHHVPPDTVRRMIEADRVPYPSRTASAADNRYVYSEFFGVGGDPATAAETISVVVQRAPDRAGPAPDRYDVGLVTAYCSAGVPSSGDYQRLCPDDLPPPFSAR